jgi:hypothetical protein
MGKISGSKTMERWKGAGGFLLAPVCLSLLVCGGCLVKKRPAAHFVTVALAHPVIPAPIGQDGAGDAPDLGLEAAPMPALLGAPRNPPARPKVAAPIAAQSSTEKPREPVIVPDLSSGEVEAAKADAQASLNVAERNLGVTKGKALNAAQADLASKVRGFMEAAREAMNDSDWERAKTMAKKAEVLSRELAGRL